MLPDLVEPVWLPLASTEPPDFSGGMAAARGLNERHAEGFNGAA